MKHPSLVIEKNAQLDANIYIGPNSYIGSNVKIGRGTKILSNVFNVVKQQLEKIVLLILIVLLVEKDLGLLEIRMKLFIFHIQED